MPCINHFFLDKQFRQNLRKQFLSWYFLTYCAIIATQCVSCALFWRDFSNALMAGQLPSSKSIKRLWCEQPLSPVRMKLKVIIVQSAGDSQRDEWWHTFNMDLFCDNFTFILTALEVQALMNGWLVIYKLSRNGALSNKRREKWKGKEIHTFKNTSKRY